MEMSRGDGNLARWVGALGLAYAGIGAVSG
jgi:hypothetical protein